MYIIVNKLSLPWGDYIDPVAGSAANTRWYSLLQNTLASKYGTTWNDSYSSNAQLASIAMLFQCPDAPGYGAQVKNAAGTAYAQVHYMCHPRLMPENSSGAGHPFGTPVGTANEKPYKISKVRRSAEIALLFDAPLAPAAAGDNVWGLWQNSGVANHIDNDAAYAPGYTAGTMTDVKYVFPRSAGDSVNMKPLGAGGLPNTDSDKNIQNIRFRHNKDTTSNVLMVDGHVESFTYNPKRAVDDKAVTNFLRRNLFVNPN
jgi:prepilin-type processing-associated H-X9-DG protein